MRKLSLLRDLARHGSIVAVSRSIGISSSAISQQLAKLEAEVGLPLLERIGRGVQLTPAGQVLAERAGSVESILEGAEAELERRRSRVQGVVRFAAFSTFALRHLPSLLRRMARTHPDVVVEFAHVEPAEALESVAGRRADIAVTDEYPGIPRAVDPHMVSTFLLRDGIAAYAPDARTPPAELPWVLEPEGSGAREWAERVCREAGFVPRVLFESPDLRLHYDLAAAGIAAAFLPDMVLPPRGGAALGGTAGEGSAAAGGVIDAGAPAEGVPEVGAAFGRALGDDVAPARIASGGATAEGLAAEPLAEKGFAGEGATGGKPAAAGPAIAGPGIDGTGDSGAAGQRLVWPEGAPAGMHRDVHAVMRRGGDTRPAVAAFLEHMRAVTAPAGR
ncbi:LysR family transcriptional regulator [Gulosibacter sp. 10]|uniref:LysR family transcriptional regulator n=1 Tax=Gulosibacter sp. 10 TaxID=1255570 RepID=UPI00159531DA|nr:LysR family transcriptional regulator [Gulosibacter sp. 10]